MLRVYIASAYTKGDTAVNVKVQLDMFNELATKGYAPFAPLWSHYQHIVHPLPYETWLALDLEWVKQCDVVLRIPGVSSGADREVAFAEERGIPVVYSAEELYGQFPVRA